MCIRPHCTSTCDLRDNSGLYSVGKSIKLERWVLYHSGKAQVHKQYSLSMKVTAWRLIPSGPVYRYILGLMMVMAACRLWTWQFVVLRASYWGTNPMCMPMTFAKVHSAQMIPLVNVLMAHWIMLIINNTIHDIVHLKVVTFMCTRGPAPHVARGWKTLQMHGFLYEYMGKLQRAVTLILRCELKFSKVKSLASIHSACPCKNYLLKCSQSPQTLNAHVMNLLSYRCTQ